MSLTPEQFEALLKALNTSDGSNSAILVFSGIVALAGIIMVIWFIFTLKFKSVDKMEKQIDSIQTMLTEMSSKMWTPDNLDNRIRVIVAEQISKHEQSCSYRKTR